MEKEIKNIIYIYIISNSTRSMDRGFSQNRENHAVHPLEKAHILRSCGTFKQRFIPWKETKTIPAHAGTMSFTSDRIHWIKH